MVNFIERTEQVEALGSMPYNFKVSNPKKVPQWLKREPVIRPGFSPPKHLTDRIPVLAFPVRLETRFVGQELLVRIYPDQLVVETHEHELTHSEVLAGRSFRERCAAVGDNQTTRRDAWRQLAGDFGALRASWIVRQLPMYDQYTTESDLARLADDAWTVAPTVRLLPDRFLVTVYKTKDLPPAYVKTGRRIPPELPLMKGPGDTDNGNDLWGAGAKWVSDFSEAEGLGMAVSIPLDGLLPPFSHVIVVGLRESLEPENTVGLVEEWIDGQHYTYGFEFLPYGTPTNNTSDAKSGHSKSVDGSEESYDTELLGTGGESLDRMTNGGRLKRALGLAEASEVFNSIRFASAASDSYAQEAQALLWSVTGDYFIETMLGEIVPTDARSRLTEHFSRFVRGQGPLSAIRVGNLPYGVLPVTRVGPTSSSDATGWAPSLADSSVLGGDAQAWNAFDARFHSVLYKLFQQWLEIALQTEESPDRPAPVPRIGESHDPDQELLRILSMEPRATSYKLRPFVDERFIGALLILLRYRFAPAGHESEWVRQWVETWLGKREPLIRFLGDLGASHSAVEAAPLLRIFSWGEGSQLTGELVGNWIEYFRILCEQGSGASPHASNTLLYDMLRSRLQRASNTKSIHSAICNLVGAPVLEFFNRAYVPERIAEALKNVSRFGRISTEMKATRFELGRRLLNARRSLPNRRFTNIQQIQNVIRAAPNELYGMVAASSDPKPVDLDGLFRDTLDLCTHRLDAWLTSLATRRLEGMREKCPTGIHIGAYGWVEGLDRAGSGGGAARGASAQTPGYIHAPSIGQAAAAAVMRNAFLTHDQSDHENSFRIDLTSTRIQLALRLLEGVREGQSLGALLGYHLERGLHTASLDRYIDNFRNAYPLISGKEVQMTGHEEAAEPQEAVAPRSVVDGLAMAEAFRKGELNVRSYVDKQDANLAPDEQAEVVEKLQREVDRLRDALDALGDLLLTESVYQSVQGNFDRAGAALEAAAGNARPPDMESIRTPTPGIGLRHRICLFLPNVDTASQPSSDETRHSPRYEAEGRLAAWTATLLNISEVDFRVDGSNPVRLSDVLEQFGLEPIDILYMSAIPPTGEETELERWLRLYAREQLEVGPGALVKLNLDLENGVNQMLEVAKNILALVTESSPLRPDALVRPEENPTPTFNQTTFDELDRRVISAQDRLSLVVAQLSAERILQPGISNGPSQPPPGSLGPSENAVSLSSSPTAQPLFAVLLEAARYGIPGAVPDSSMDIDQRRGPVLSEAQNRLSKCASLRDQALQASVSTLEARIELLQKAMKALFGASFVVLPVFNVSTPETLGNALIQNGRLGPIADDRILLWLQQASETHKGARCLEDALMATHAWNQNSFDAMPKLKVAQLPFCEHRPWQALSDDEIRPLAGDPSGTTGDCKDPIHGRPRAVLSLVAVMTGANEPDWNSVAGLLIDQWTETIPRDEVESGISFQYNAPSSQAPHTLLLAVPGNFEENGRWTTEKLRDIVKDTLDLAKVRLVDPDALRGAGGALPALFMPVDSVRPGWDRKIDFPTLKQWAAAFSTNRSQRK